MWGLACPVQVEATDPPLRVHRMAHVDAPGGVVRFAAKGAHLPQVEKDVIHPGGSQEIGDAIGYVVLGDAVEGSKTSGKCNVHDKISLSAGTSH